MNRIPTCHRFLHLIALITLSISIAAPFQEKRVRGAEKKATKTENLQRQIDQQAARIAELEAQLNQISGVVLPDVKTALETMVRAKAQSDSATIMLINRINTIQNKIKLLEDKAAYSDSTNYEILAQLVMIENKIITLTRSFNELYAIRSDRSLPTSKKISDEDYRRNYVEALSHYQNGEFQKAIEGFSELVISDSKHSLADNSQYWLGECYYSLKNYKRAILEFEKVLEYSDSDKLDDAQLKLGLSYLSIGNEEKARDEFQKLLDIYPNSEYYSKAQQYLRQL